MGWTPKISELDGFPDTLEKGLLYSLSRIQNYHSELHVVQVFDDVKICHGDSLSSPVGQAFKGDDCWTKEMQAEHRTNKESNSTPLLSAYRNSSIEHSGNSERSCHWCHCEFY